MAKLSIEEIYQAARAAGFTPEQATTWTAIALAESGGRTGALNDRGEHSMGLWQVNVSADAARATRYGDLNDPLANARAAYEISRHGRDLRPWTTTHDSNKGTAQDYRRYLDEVEAVTGVRGDHRGVGGYQSSLPPALAGGTTPESTSTGRTTAVATAAYDRIDTGRSVAGQQQDADHDGLTDAFERAAGTSLKVADTDRDGLADGYEAAVSKTDARRADTDQDGLSDSSEQTLGTAGTKWDSDRDGLSDQAELRFGSDPTKADSGEGLPPAGRTVAAAQVPATPPAAPAAAAAAAAAGGPVAGQASGPADRTKVDRFVNVALAQDGDRYVFGTRAELSDPDPERFDCSELTKWAAHQAGVEIPDGAMYQYLTLKHKNALMPVEEALHTKGALLFYFSSEPVDGGGRPSKAHVAISLGDGRTIEAKGTKYGVGEFTARNRFNYAGVIPGLDASAPPPADPVARLTPPGAGQGTPDSGPETPGAGRAAQSLVAYDQIDGGVPVSAAPKDADKDGLTDAFEKLAGLNPRSADTDKDGLSDPFEAIRSHTDPLTADTDKDGLSDPFELSAGSNAGRIPGIAGVAGHGQQAEVVRHGVKDTDHDGLTDTYERKTGLNPARTDSDRDGLADNVELTLGTSPTLLDSDRDGMGDALEVRFGTGSMGAGPVGSGSTGGSLGAGQGGDLGGDLGGAATAPAGTGLGTDDGTGALPDDPSN